MIRPAGGNPPAAGHDGRVNDDVEPQRTPVDVALDLFWYAPIGASIEMWERVPELARLGRDRISSQAPGAKMIGRLAVTTGRARLTHVVSELAKTGARTIEDLGRGGARDDRAAGSDETTEPAPAALDEVPIEGYDDMTAVEVIPLLGDLTADERDRVRRHESEGRARRTILGRLDQLDAAAG